MPSSWGPPSSSRNSVTRTGVTTNSVTSSNDRCLGCIPRPTRTLTYFYIMRPNIVSHMKTFLLSVMVCSITLMVLRVHHNQERLQPVVLSIEASTPAPIKFKSCSQDERRGFVRDYCKLAKRGGDRLGVREVDNVKIMVVNDEQKLLYCVMSKTGTKSWLHYMVSMAGKVKPGKWHFRKPDFMSKAGLNYRRHVSVSEVNTKYKDYFKFIVTRHPLQRLASAYYEAILKAGHHKKPDGTPPNFTEFTSKLDSEFPPALHWSLYQDECQLCGVKYDFIVKTETVEEDSQLLKKTLGSDVNLTVRHTNFLYEDSSLDVFKYDHMFNDVMNEQPKALETALSVYESDMETLGYQWDWDNRRSTCDNDNGSGGVCC